MVKKYKLIFKYIRSLSGILILLGALLVFISNAIWDWQAILANFGLAFLAAGITTYLLKYDIDNYLSNDNIRNSGIEVITHGRNAMVESLGGISELFLKSRPKEIDIIGIAMYSFFEPNNLYDEIINLANDKYKIRIVFADPGSKELTSQERVENKPGSLKYHIEYIVEQFRIRAGKINPPDNFRNNFILGYSSLLPKSFIIRFGSRMMVSEYFYRGPHYSPTYFLKDIPNGLYETYYQYINDIFDRSFIKVDLLNKNENTG